MNQTDNKRSLFGNLFDLCDALFVVVRDVSWLVLTRECGITGPTFDVECNQEPSDWGVVFSYS